MNAAAKLLLLIFCLSLTLIAYQAKAASPDKAASAVKQEASKEKWEYYASDEDGTDYSYDPSSVKRLKSDHVEVWVRARYSAKNPKYSHAELQWELDCAKKSMRGLTARSKKKDGTEENVKTPSNWSAIPPDSTAEALYETVCKNKEKRNP